MSRGGYTRDRGDPEKERPTLEGAAVAFVPPAEEMDASDHSSPAESPAGAPTAKMWMTPRANENSESAETFQARRIRMSPADRMGVNGTLSIQAQTWSTPRASDGEKGGPNQSFGAGGVPLPSQAANWPTPSANQYEAADLDKMLARQKRQAEKHGNNGVGLTLANAALLWPTPTASDDGQKVTLVAHQRMLCNEVIGFRPSPPDHPTPDGPPSSPERRSLNPLFVEWLMGWPTGLSGFARSETEWCRWLRQMRGYLWTLGSAEMPLQGSLL